MEQLPKVLCFAISKAAKSGKLLWSIWNSKTFWKPEALLLSWSASPPPRPSQPQGKGLPSAINNKAKKRCSPPSKKQSNRQLWNFLAKKKGQGVKTAGAQESPGTLNDAHLPSSPEEYSQKVLVEEPKAAEPRQPR